jgi:protein tyrosine phosphatase (PTP) superfamily phosphohydrolase (DUF442 family)
MTTGPLRFAIVARALALALLVVVGAACGRTLLGLNFHTVLSGRCYRCAQPATAELRVLVQKLKIRTIINLRGREDEPWYGREHALARELGIRVVDEGMWAARPATEAEFRKIVETVDSAEEPILVHCVSGIDRTGIVSAIFLLLRTDANVDAAMGQLSVRFGHNPWGKAACQDRILEGYAAWLAERGLRHRPDLFRRWAQEDYRQEFGHDWSELK